MALPPAPPLGRVVAVNSSALAGPLQSVQDARVVSGRDESIQRLRGCYERIHARLWRAVFAWSGSRDVTDDAVAEALAQAVRRGSEIRDVDAWVWRAAFRLAAGELKRRQLRPVPVANVDDRTVEEPGPDERLDIERALATLSDQQRACVVLRDVAGLSAPEAAGVLATTAGTVRVQAMRGRRRLRELLEVRDA
jgi:RNA polymerase sigma-70 factor, ECF subfamily